MRRAVAVTSVLAAALMLAVGLAAVAVARPGDPRLDASAPTAVQQARAGTGLHAAAASYLGLSPARLRAELRRGKSLAQVAAARGKSVEGLESALLAAVKARVDAAVAAGRLDSARAQALLAGAPERIERLVSRRAEPRPHRAVAQRGLLRAAATYLGIGPRQLAAELRTGRSLAQLATARGRSVDGLKAALLSALTTRVEAAVAAGKLDAARAQRLLERAPARIARLVDRTRR